MSAAFGVVLLVVCCYAFILAGLIELDAAKGHENFDNWRFFGRFVVLFGGPCLLAAALRYFLG